MQSVKMSLDIKINFNNQQNNEEKTFLIKNKQNKQIYAE